LITNFHAFDDPTCAPRSATRFLAAGHSARLSAVHPDIECQTARLQPPLIEVRWPKQRRYFVMPSLISRIGLHCTTTPPPQLRCSINISADPDRVDCVSQLAGSTSSTSTHFPPYSTTEPPSSLKAFKTRSHPHAASHCCVPDSDPRMD
jgi:hypothetical protein